MSKKKVFVIVGLIIAIASGVFVFRMPLTEAESEVKPAMIAAAKQSVPKEIIIKNPHILKLLAEYEAILKELMERSHTPGAAVAIVRDSSILYLRGFGVKALGNKDSVDVETVFRLGSVSKCFAPVLTGMLVKEGLLSWNDQVIKYLPDFALKSKEQTDQLMIRHVLSHTVGLPYHTYTNLVEEGDSLTSMLDKLKDVNMIGDVGKVYSYQNVAYSIIAEVVRAASGKSYSTLMADKIFKPLHMETASTTYAAIKGNNNVAKPHSHTRKGLHVTSINNTYYNVAPAGGVNASAADMALWIEALLGNKKNVIDDETLNEIFKPVIRAPSKNRNFRKWISQTDSHYALGWRVLDSKTDTLFYHGGYVNGYRSELALNRRDKIGICIMTNATGELADNSAPYFFNLYLNHRDSIQQWEKRHGAAVMANTK
jgi:beta-lactamase class C